MKSVICFGEALIDFLNINRFEEKPLWLNEFRQYPGGAPANVAVAIAKLGGTSLFAGQVGKDSFGDFLEEALTCYQVDTRLMSRHPTAKTALAFVTLDEEGDRSFTFFREATADLLFKPSQIDENWFTHSSIFHFCSNTLTNEDITETTQFAVTIAKNKGLTISFDVNLRHNLWVNESVNIERVNALAEQAHVLKYSKDELDFLAQGEQKPYIENLITQGVLLVLVTDGPDTIHYYSSTCAGTVNPPRVKAVDTTAGGDAFIGGFLFGLNKVSQTSPAKLHLTSVNSIIPLINFAAACGAHAVTKPGAFPALPIFDDVYSSWQLNSLDNIS
ncbi:carbohydrate kinase [Colwellia sp. UCD-KL20]|uniref:carbohydrate kinase family protein n=1 Tax=Colwellia sp. UCD-KL20 TaxID=1917165 RepID=UPI000970B75D|nr:carbohydrate kinase [Colwellia sp. UCD-KL20]